MNSPRVCGECGAGNLPDAEFCATCGVALSTAHLHHPGLAALVDDDGERPSADTTSGTPTTAADATAGTTVASSQVAPGSSPGGSADEPRPPVVDPIVAAGPPMGRDHPSERAWLVPTVVVFAVLAVGLSVLAVLVARSDTGTPESGIDTATTTPTPTAAPTTTADEPSATAAPTTAAEATATTAAPTTTAAPDPAPTTTPPPDAATELASIAETDLTRLLSLRGRWVPQLSAKEPGTVWEGVTYDLPGIVDLHRTLDTQVGGALLAEGASLAFLRDGARMSGWWFTLADADFATAEDALQWCTNEGFDRENCGARLLTDDDTATGTLRLQPT